MNEFNRGIMYAFDFIEKHMIGRVVNGSLQCIITESELKNLKSVISIKCDMCTRPCEQPHCCTKE